jgi:hypothetical protein
VTAVLLSVHVLAAIMLIGPITAAASLFPRYGRDALATAQRGAQGAATTAAGSAGTVTGQPPGVEPARGEGHVVRALHGVSRGYGLVTVVVPVFGIATAARMGVLAQPWLWVSIALTALATVMLTTLIEPRQRRVLNALDQRHTAPNPVELARGADAELQRLSMLTGIFALTWTVVGPHDRQTRFEHRSLLMIKSAMTGTARPVLRIAAFVEPVSLLVLLANLATVHIAGVAALIGPLHGTAYLVAITATWTGRYPPRARLLAWLPGIGAPLALRASARGLPDLAVER